MTRGLHLVVLGVLAGSCSPSGPGSVPAPLSSPPLGPASAPGRDVRAASPSAAPDAQGVYGRARLGLPCAGPSPAPTRVEWDTDVCGPSGQVVGVFLPGDATDEPPPGATVVFGEPRGSMEASYVALGGDQLWIRMIQCPRCRRIMGWGFVGYPARMTGPQQAALRTLVALRAAGPLTDPRTWSAFP